MHGDDKTKARALHGMTQHDDGTVTSTTFPCRSIAVSSFVIPATV
jgi:hypothetical protein